jgi:hypothetical protein
MVRLISITQLARQAPASEITRVTTSKNSTELVWEGEKVTVQHPPPATVPFLAAYLGNPPESYGEFYKSVCAFVALPMLNQCAKQTKTKKYMKATYQ